MASDKLIEVVNSYDYFVRTQGVNEKVIDAYIMAQMVAIQTENDPHYGYEIGKKARNAISEFLKKQTGGDFGKVEEYAQANKLTYDIIEKYYNTLLAEAPFMLDSYCLYIERDRLRKERFYEPRRKTLIRVVDKLQDLEDDKLDELFVHQPPRTGKTQIMTFGTAWHCAKNTHTSNLYCTYKEDAGGAFRDGTIEVWTDPIYRHRDVFPLARVVDTDARENTVDLERKKKYKSLSCKGLTSGLNGLYDASGWMVIDDILEGIQDVLSSEVLHRKQIIFDNNLMTRKKEKCKVIYNGTIWSLHDIYMNRLDFLQNNPAAAKIRWDVLKLPALNENDESNFDYEYGVGFSSEYYQTKRAKYEEDDDMASWYAQFQQEPIERDGAVFSPDKMNFYNGVLPKEEPVRICAACDVALGGLDFLACAVAYIYENGSVYIHDVVFDNSEKDITQPQVVEAIVNNNVGSAFFESNAGGEGYKDDIERKLKEKGIRINMTSKYAPINKRKEQRIWDKAPSIRSYYFRDVGSRSPEYRKFMTNLYSFTMNGSNKHDDAPDCLATLAMFIEGTWAMATVDVIDNPFRRR